MGTPATENDPHRGRRTRLGGPSDGGKPDKTVIDEGLTILSKADAEKFIAALANPPEPNQALRDLMRRK